MSGRAEIFTLKLYAQPVERIIIAANARQPEEDGYPVSGDALALIHERERGEP